MFQMIRRKMAQLQEKKVQQKYKYTWNNDIFTTGRHTPDAAASTPATQPLPHPTGVGRLGSRRHRSCRLSRLDAGSTAISRHPAGGAPAARLLRWAGLPPPALPLWPAVSSHSQQPRTPNTETLT